MDTPIACSLDTHDYADRRRRLRALRDAALIDRKPIAGGERLLFADAADTEQALRAAIDAEAGCCAFLTMTLDRRAGRLILDITGPEMAAPIIEELFA